jgi:hypothetical protein
MKLVRRDRFTAGSLSPTPHEVTRARGTSKQYGEIVIVRHARTLVAGGEIGMPRSSYRIDAILRNAVRANAGVPITMPGQGCGTTNLTE